MDRQLRKWLTETAYYKATTAITSAGVETFGAAVSFTCRTEYQRVIHGPMFMPRGGEDEEFMHLIFTETNVPDDARIWLPGDSTSNDALARKIRRKETVRDELGAVSHYEIYI